MGAGELLTSGPRGDRRRRRGGRWLVLVLVVALSAVPVGRFVRDRLDRAAVHRLGVVWAKRAATHGALAAVTSSVEDGAAPQDRVVVRRSVAALQREDAARLHGLIRAAAGARAYGAARGLRSDVVAALTAEEQALLAAAAAGTEVDPVGLVAGAPARRVEADFTSLTGWSPTVSGSASPVRLHAADAVLRRLSRLLDVPLPVRLLVNGPGGPAVLDLARNRTSPAPAALDVPTGLLRGDYFVVDLPGPQALAVPIAGGAARLISGGATDLAPGPRPDQVWVGDRNRGLATLVDVAGRVLQRVTVPGTLQGAVRGGLVVATAGRLSVWDPARGRILRRLPNCPTVLAAAGSEVVLSDCPWETGAGGLVHVVDVTTGRDRVLRLPPGDYQVPAATLAPDGRHLAILAAPQNGVGQLLVADIPAGTVTPVATPGAPNVRLGTVWTADSRRLFLTAGGSFDAPTASLWTYRLGDRAATAIRYLRAGPVTPLAVLPSL